MASSQFTASQCIASPISVTVEDLSSRLARADAPVLIDVCIDADFDADPRLIPSARKHPNSEISDVAADLKSKQVIIICQKGLKLSQGAAALLRARGVNARFLEGGNFAWRDAHLPLLAVRWTDGVQPSLGFIEASRWVVPTSSGLPVLAACWVLQRFFDPSADFMFVEPDAVADVADRFEANVAGELNSVLERFGISTPELDTIRTIVEDPKSDIQNWFTGLSHIVRDDRARMDALLPVLDALTHWARHSPPSRTPDSSTSPTGKRSAR
ncbi:MAG: chromate resistance protein ChrB domain-containing protein [Pseudomonadota bacterium]